MDDLVVTPDLFDESFMEEDELDPLYTANDKAELALLNATSMFESTETTESSQHQCQDPFSRSWRRVSLESDQTHPSTTVSRHSEPSQSKYSTAV